MPITNEQKTQFERQTFPNAVNLKGHPRGAVYNGKEAVLTRVGSKAFKWYASLSGRSINDLIKYADGINQDEKSLLNLGLSQSQVPLSEFFISEYDRTRPELFAIQPWSDGVNLNQLSFWEIIKNRNLRHNLGNLFLTCSKRYQYDKQIVDITGANRIKLLGREFADPTVFIWPFRTTNIMVEGDLPIIVDAKSNNPNTHPLIRAGVIGQMHISKAIGRLLTAY